MNRLLMTGASGFLGRHCLEALTTAFEIHAVSSSLAPGVREGITWHQANLLRADAAHTLMEAASPTHLLHLAWVVGPGYWTSPENSAWFEASKRLFESFFAHGGRRVVAAGSCAEYEWGPPPYAERTTPLRPKTPYGWAKHASQLELQRLADEHGGSFAWARIFYLYGPHERPGRLVPDVIRALLEGREATCSSGRQRRDYVYVRDAAQIFSRLLSGEFRGVVNVAAGVAPPISEVVMTLARLCAREDLVRLGALPDRTDDPPCILADTSILRDEVGFVSCYPLVDGLRETIEWWRHEREGASGHLSWNRSGGSSPN